MNFYLDLHNNLSNPCGALLFPEAGQTSLSGELISLPSQRLHLIPGIEPNIINKVEIVEYL